MDLLSAVIAALSLGPQHQAPEFRADVRLIRLDVSVVDGRGRAVAGLGPEDFAVAEDGRAVEIAHFEAVVAGGSPGPGPARRILLLVDAGPMTPAQLLRARDGVTGYLRGAATDGDWVRLVDLASGRAWDGDIPADRDRLEAAARRLIRRPLPSWGSDLTDPIEDRVEVETDAGPSSAETSGRFMSELAQASGLLGALESLLVQLGGVSGRKALVLVSPGFPQLRGLDRRLEDVASLAREAATTLYFVDAAGLDRLVPERGGRMVPAFEAAWRRSGGAHDLALATGGFTSRFSNALLPALQRVEGELRTYYVLGYVPPRADDGQFRSVAVKVRVPGLSARTKKGYRAGPRR